MTSLIFGLLLAQFSYGVIYTIIFVIIFEICVIYFSRKYPPQVRICDRLLINVFFFLGFFIGRYLCLDEDWFQCSEYRTN